MSDASPIILAVDTTDLERVKWLIDETRDSVSIFKFGLEFYLRHGMTVLHDIKNSHSIDVFLDLKLHDIPNTVGKAAESLSILEPKIVTVHGAGGTEMVKEAVSALPRVTIAAVTVLTSLDHHALSNMGIRQEIPVLVEGIARSSVAAGATALVTSPHEVATLRAQFPTTMLITPGIRPMDRGDDQRRTMTPLEAITAGSTYLVIGRPITQASSPRESAREILHSVERS